MLSKNRNSGVYSEIDVVSSSISKANSVDILEIFKNYSIGLDSNNHKVCCPFLEHKNGHERSASFYYYPQSNSFYCFGCKIGGRCVDFVSNFEGISRYHAAKSILEIFESGSVKSGSGNTRDETSASLLEFSHVVRSFLKCFSSEKIAFEYAESLCLALDNVRNKFSIEKTGMESLVQKLKNKLQEFKLS